MRYGLPLSFFFHAVIIAAVLFGLPVFSKPVAEKSIEVPVEIVRFDESSNPPPGRKEDQRDERTPDDDKTTGKNRSADGGKTRPVVRPETAPQRPPEPEVAFAQGALRLGDWTARVESALATQQRQGGPAIETRPAYVAHYFRLRSQRAGLLPGQRRSLRQPWHD